MKRSLGLAPAILLSCLIPEAELRAEEPVIKPPWQRLLQGADAKTAAEQEEKLDRLQEAGRFAEALKVAEQLAELRKRVQGEDHWETIDARWMVKTLRRILKQTEQTRKEYAGTFARAREADALENKERYKEALSLREKLLTIRRKALGEDHPDTATSYDEVASNLDDLGRLKEAEVSYRKALAIRRKLLGEEHPDTAISYNNVAFNQNAQGNYREAEEGYLKSLAIRRKVLGEEHSSIASSYSGIGENQNSQGKYKEAEESHRKALAIRRKVLGEEHPDTATSYTSVAYNLENQEKYKDAEEYFRKALAIRIKVLGEEHFETATSYHDLASNLDDQDRHKEGEEFYRKALAIRRKVKGEEHRDTGRSYNYLAINLDDQGRHKEAEECYLKDLAITRKLLGEEHPDTATSYNNVGYNQSAQGKYKEAEEVYHKALAIRRKVLGEEHPDTATSYNTIAFNQFAQGRYKEAEESHRKSLAIRLKLLGEEHSHTATCYDRIGLNLDEQGKYKEGEEYHQKALAIRRKVLGEEHLQTAISYSNLAHNQSAQHKYKDAEAGHLKDLSITRKVLGEEHPLTARSYYNVAGARNAQGKYKEAEAGYRQALAIELKSLGEEHPETARSYSKLAYNQEAQGKYQEAEALWSRAAAIFNKVRLQIAATGLQRATITSEHSPLLPLAAVSARNKKPEAAWQCFEESLARGTWDDLTARLQRPQTERDKQARLAARIDRLNKLIEKSNTIGEPASEQKARRKELLTQLRAAQDESADFARHLEETYGPIAGQIFSRDKIQAALPDNAACVAWLDFAGRAKAADPNGDHWAVLLRSSGSPIWVRLPGSGDKDAWTEDDTELPSRLRDVLRSPGREWQPIAQRLRRQRLDPLASHLKGVRRLIVLPSTALAGVPVEAIAEGYTVSYANSGTMYAHLFRQQAPTGNGLLALADPVFETPTEKEKPEPLPPGGVLVTMVMPGSNAARAGLKPNDVLLRYGDIELNIPEDLKPPTEPDNPEKQVPLIVWRDGDKLPRPLFVRPGKLDVVFAQEPAPQAVDEQRRLNRLLASRSGDDGRWDRLPGTRFEIASLNRLFDNNTSVQILLDSDSSEQRLNELAQSGTLGKYRYIHLATHGEVDDVFPLRSAVILSRDRLPDDTLRTKLLMSGQPIADGRLTAEEALQRWNLHCDLVTLSACQTALGKYERGEGYVGFAQALILCGSRSVCLSLWKVDDVATALLMERFYQNLLGKRVGLTKPMPKAAALAEAKAWLRELPRAEALERAASLSEGVTRGPRKKLPVLEVPPADKSDGKYQRKPNEDRPYAHPYYWAAFILIGASE